MELAVQVPGQLSIAGMTSVGTPGGCQAAVATSEGRVGRQWFAGLTIVKLVRRPSGELRR
jgi:hypothetical protein